MLNGIEVITSPYVPGPALKPYPKHLKRYKRRTMKRWAANPNHWVTTIYQVDGKLVCHPDALRMLYREIQGLNNAK